MELLQGTDSSQTSSPWSSDIASDGVSSGSLNSAQVPFPSSSASSAGPRVAMLRTGGEEAEISTQGTVDSEVPTVKSALARGSESQDGMGEEWVEQYQVREAEAVIPSVESCEEVHEELAGLHQRLALLVCQSGRDVSSSAERGSIDLLQELSTQKDELEWLLQLSDLEKLEENCQVARALALRAAHLEAQPLTHTRLISNQEVNERLKDWKEAMAAEFQSLRSKGAIQVVSDQQVREWIHSGEDVEVLPGRGVASEKPAEPPQAKPKKKYRAVICGNFQKYSERREAESLYAGGADSLSIRTALRLQHF